MKLVIFSYPLHFIMMQLAYKNAIDAIDGIDEVVIVWDDIFNRDDKNITNKKLLEVIPATKIIYHSEIDSCKDEPLGWLRQQYIKLDLHNILEDDQWVILDSDVILREKKKFTDGDTLVFYTFRDFYQPYFDFIKHVFDIDKIQSPTYMTSFALFERSVLTAINDWCMKHHDKNLITLFKEFYRPLKNSVYKEPMTPPLSEFEIYGLFYERILSKPIKCIQDTIPIYEPIRFQRLYWQKKDCYYLGVDSDLHESFLKMFL